MKGKIYIHKNYCGRKCANIRLDDKSESKTILCSKCLLQNVNKRSKQKICNSCQIKPKRKLRNLVEFICEVCNKNFQDKKSRVYCSKSCSTIKRNKDGMARRRDLNLSILSQEDLRMKSPLLIYVSINLPRFLQMNHFSMDGMLI